MFIRDTYNDNDNDMEAGDDRDGGNGEDSEEEISTNENWVKEMKFCIVGQRMIYF